MNVNIIPALIGATSGVIVAGLGWFITWKQADRSRKKQAALQYLERQIGELYGPLLGLITYSRIVSEVKKKLLLTTLDGETGNFRDNLDVEVARFFERNYSFPINKEIRRLIGSKMHLLDSTELPTSFEDFFKHEAEYECLHELWSGTEGKVRADEDYKGEKIIRKRWPNDFEADVWNKLKQLRSEHRRFLEEITAAKKNTRKGPGSI